MTSKTVAFIFFMLLAIAWAFTFRYAWGVFIVPLGLLPLSAAHAFGISHIVYVATWNGWTHEEKPVEMAIVTLVARTGALLLTTFALSFFM